VLAAIVQLQASLEAAVMPRPARFAMARVCIRVAFPVIRTHVGAILLAAIFTGKVGSAVASAIEASAMRFIASLHTGSNAAIDTTKPFIAMAQASPLLAHTMAIAVTRARLW